MKDIIMKKMKIQRQRNWDYDYFKVIIDGKKYPRERGEWYTPYGKDEDEDLK